VVLEPRSNTMRRKVLQDALARSLALADQIVVAAIFKSEAIPEDERLDLNRVIDEIKERGKQARIFADADAIVNAIAPELREPDVVAILSNGGFGGIYEKLPQHLRELGRKALGAQTLGVRT
jgi:UDP-N-acetylmuramate: L-alanyl-gamma-D-glutamyl-meso-diaminopimelate ligase